MKLKKFFAGVLAVAMMLTVGATAAFAETITVPGEDYKGAKMLVADGNQQANVTLTKILEVKEGTAPDEMKFNFTVTADGNSTALATASTEFKIADQENKVFNTTNGEDGSGIYKRTFDIDVAALTKDKPVGEYTFTITETMAKAYQSVTAERETLTMVVSKVNAKELKADSTAEFGYFVALKTASGKVLATEAFKNFYGDKGSIHDLTLSKTVHGALGDLSKKFTFTIKFTKADTLKENNDTGLYKGPMVAEITGEDASIVVKNTTNSIAANSYLELDKEYTVTLRHGGSLKLSNLPAGIKYEVCEDGSTVDGSDVVLNTTNTSGQSVKYVVTVKDASSQKVGFDSSANTVSGSVSADVTTAFHNTNDAEPDMGVVLDNAPYIAMLAIVAIGGVALMLNKRRRDEE